MRPTESHLHDYELLARWSSGDQAAGDLLVQRHFRQIFRYFRRRLDRDAEDLVQQTFLGCLEAADRFEAGRPLRPFLFEIAYRQLCKHLRRSGIRKSTSISEARFACPDTTPSQVASRRQSEALLLGAVRKLPDDLGAAVQLHYWDGMTMAEAGELIGVPAGTVKSRLHRARELLRSDVGDLGLLDAIASSHSRTRAG